MKIVILSLISLLFTGCFLFPPTICYDEEKHLICMEDGTCYEAD